MAELYKEFGRPVYWKSTKYVHICDGSEVHRGVKLLWTLCGKDVPANKAHTLRHDYRKEHDLDHATCEKCKDKYNNPKQERAG